ncbi:MAG: hypothetical protein K0R71_685 [Bacillales bacterium]|jgi:uncharacterized integral membrane protein (TIGR02327 family)|nr:hypothetical protein [Bacillales bacterium]
MQTSEINAVVQIFIHLSFIAISWWAIQAIHFEKILRKNKIVQVKALYILLSIALGSLVSNFFLNYLQMGINLSSLFYKMY